MTERSRIYTRKGDGGETSLVDGTRVPKHSDRVEAYGEVDEANAWIGAARAFVSEPVLDGALEFLQHRFFNCSSNIATPPGASFEPPRVSPEDAETLEKLIDRFEARTGRVTHFVLPGGTQAAGFLHVARTVCRRAERKLTRLQADEPIDANVLRFINRASDFLFAAARYANAIEEREDTRWDPALTPPKQ